MKPDAVDLGFAFASIVLVGGVAVLGVMAGLSLVRTFVEIAREARAARLRRWWL